MLSKPYAPAGSGISLLTWPSQIRKLLEGSNVNGASSLGPQKNHTGSVELRSDRWAHSLSRYRQSQHHTNTQVPNPPSRWLSLKRVRMTGIIINMHPTH